MVYYTKPSYTENDTFPDLFGCVPESEPEEEVVKVFDLCPRRTMEMERKRSRKQKLRRILHRVFNRGHVRRMAYAVDSFATKMEDKLQEGRETAAQAARAGCEQIDLLFERTAESYTTPTFPLFPTFIPRHLWWPEELLIQDFSKSKILFKTKDFIITLV